MSSLKTHIREGKEASSPFRYCDKKFVTVSTFSSHVSRKHKDSSEQHLVESIRKPHCFFVPEQSDMQIGALSNDEGAEEVFPEITDEALFLR